MLQPMLPMEWWNQCPPDQQPKRLPQNNWVGPFSGLNWVVVGGPNSVKKEQTNMAVPFVTEEPCWSFVFPCWFAILLLLFIPESSSFSFYLCAVNHAAQPADEELFVLDKAAPIAGLSLCFHLSRFVSSFHLHLSSWNSG